MNVTNVRMIQSLRLHRSFILALFLTLSTLHHGSILLAPG